MHKGKIINFELLHSDNYNVLIEEMSQARAEGHDAIIGLLLMDGFVYKNTQEFFANMQTLQSKANELGIQKVVLVPGICENFKQQLEDNGIWFDIAYYDYSQHMVQQSYKDLELYDWNRYIDKFLMLGGVPSRPNRIRLLSKLYNKQLLDRAEWSFFKPWTDEDKLWCRSALHEYSDAEYDIFLLTCDRAIDNLYEDAKQYSKAELEDLKTAFDNEWCKDPAYIDPRVFASTSLSIISEGLAYDPATDFRYITEKTWRTIANKHPFIMAGYVEQSAYARSKGLRTFNQYMLIPDYDLIEDTEQRLDAIVQNVEYFLNTFSYHSEQISADIEHNYQIFLATTEYNKSVLDTFKTEYQISDSEISKWFDHKSFIHLIRALDAN
jgi:hypothetical protein